MKQMGTGAQRQHLGLRNAGQPLPVRCAGAEALPHRERRARAAQAPPDRPPPARIGEGSAFFCLTSFRDPSKRGTIISMENETIQRAFKALGDPTRLRIVGFLGRMCCGRAIVNDEGGVYEGPTAGEVCCHLTGAERITSTVSHHLHELEAAGIVRIERSGKRMLCTLRPETLESLGDTLRAIAKGEPANACC